MPIATGQARKDREKQLSGLQVLRTRRLSAGRTAYFRKSRALWRRVLRHRLCHFDHHRRRRPD